MKDKKTEQVATQVVSKYLRKGNMAGCLRDILPSSGLSKEQREAVAELVHTVVRWEKLYDHLLETQPGEGNPQRYVTLAMQGAEAEAASLPFELRYSCSSYVADVLKDYADWAGYLNQTPPTTLCVNLNKSTIEDTMSLLHDEQIFAERSVLNTAIRTTSVSKYSKVLQQRFAHVQDENSQLIAHVAASYGDSIFDFCAGNGGKSLAMASLSRNTKHLSAYEINAAKRTNLVKRCGDYQAQVKIEHSIPSRVFDVVLVDAPCTGLGAARRNPEVKYIENADEFPSTQLSILEEAAKNVRDQGFLLYTVCTFTPEETTQVAKEFMKHTGFSSVPFTNCSFQKLLQPTKLGVFSVVPRGDLFFLSLLQK
ncbi:MAG TPA: RsmB/NOP family class I SAM-dependent RNA methyltransferase [Candidatus Thermoplasmatota archaeon]|nr:RsmB/NOP family class I SAM-dependent RNA methyltransferase [Candidatus Thermoplasmatota archaeon]